MEHPLNGQYVLRCQRLYYKLCWSVYSYFISFINPPPRPPYFACQHICLPSSSDDNSGFCKLCYSASVQKGGEQSRDGLEREEICYKCSKIWTHSSVCLRCSLNLISLVNVTLLPFANVHIMYKCASNIYCESLRMTSMHLCRLTRRRTAFSHMKDGEKGVRHIGRAEGGEVEEKWCSTAENCHGRAKGALEGPLIIVQPCMDFTLRGCNDHLMKVFISNININYRILLNVSVLV